MLLLYGLVDWHFISSSLRSDPFLIIAPPSVFLINKVLENHSLPSFLPLPPLLLLHTSARATAKASLLPRHILKNEARADG